MHRRYSPRSEVESPKLAPAQPPRVVGDEFVVFESPEVNAWCLPSGKVGVSTGNLPITKDEAGLATVIEHEVAHATARHGAERMSEQMAAKAAGK